MKRKRISLAIFIILMVGLLISSSPDYTQQSKNINQPAILLALGQPMLTDEIMETEEWQKSSEEYYIEQYGENYMEIFERNALSADNADRIRQLFELDKNGEVIYPDFIGGIYINEDHLLVIQLVEKFVPDVKDAEYSLYTKVLEVDNNIVL